MIQKTKNSNKGFIQIIILLLIIIIISYLVGFNPNTIWSNFIYPVLAFVWGVLVWLAQFLISLLQIGYKGLQDLLNLFK